MFDLQATVKWVTAVLKDPNAAAAAYRETSATWQQSFLQITLPVYVTAYVIAALVALITGGSFLFGSLSFGIVVFSLVWSLAWTLVIAFIFDYLAGVFGATRGFDKAYAVVALAIIPAAAGSAIAPLPWIGWLIGLAASIYSLMLAYRFLPLYLEIPEPSRVKHFAVSIVAAIVVNLLVSLTLGSMFAPSMLQRPDTDNNFGSGLFGGIERQASFAEAAANDTYDPPNDGKLDSAQIERYADVIRKTRELQNRLSEKFDNKDPSISDVFSGVGGAMRLSTAEIEVVKTAGGNWAEHQWVKAQIETARIQQDLNDTTQHNYALFEKYQDQIEPYE